MLRSSRHIRASVDPSARYEAARDSRRGPPPGDGAGAGSGTATSTGIANTRNHAAATSATTRMFSPSSSVIPNQCASPETKPTNTISSSRIPPR